VAEVIRKHACPQRVAKHRDDSSHLFLETCAFLPLREQIAVCIRKLFLKMLGPRGRRGTLLVKLFEPLTEIASGQRELLPGGFATSRSWSRVQVERMLRQVDFCWCLERSVYHLEDEPVDSFTVSWSDARRLSSANPLVKFVPVSDQRRGMVALGRETVVLARHPFAVMLAARVSIDHHQSPTSITDVGVVPFG
jgi:hypothetical protein